MIAIRDDSEGQTAARKERAALVSVAASAGLTIGKFVAGFASGSLALLSEAAHALLDTGATVITWLAVRAADKPADERHHYGHAKIESVAALVETGLLFALAGIVLYQAFRRLAEGGGDVVPTSLAFAVLIVSIVVDITRVVSLRRIAAETKSHALAADAMHFASDLASSVLVLVGLVAALYGFRYGDALAAIGVAVFIAIAGVRLSRSTIDVLLDTAPAGLADHLRRLASDVPGVVKVGDIRVRRAGASIFGEIELAVPRTLPLDRVASIQAAMADAVRADYPEAALTVATTPIALDDETVLDRIMLIAARRRVPVHHVTVQDIGEGLSVSLDLEVDGRMSLAAAHAIASNFEAAVRAEFGPLTEVETHIEPLEATQLAGQDAEHDTSARIAAALAARAGETGIIEDVHDIRVRDTPTGLVVNYHCKVDPALDVATVHEAVDRLERRVRAEHSDICRVVGHSEPKQ